MAGDEEEPSTRHALVGVGEVLRLTREDIGEHEVLQVIGVLSRPPGGSPPASILTPSREHVPIQVGGGISAYVVDPHTVITGDDMISFPVSMLRSTRWAIPETHVELDGVRVAPLFEGLIGDASSPRFVILVRDAPEEPGG